jgi:hypothetical protein
MTRFSSDGFQQFMFTRVATVQLKWQGVAVIYVRLQRPSGTSEEADFN